MKVELSGLADLAWNQFWQVTIVALVAWALVRLFCRKRPHLAYVLWMLVVMKCLTPPIWSSPTGVFSWVKVQVMASSQSQPLLVEPDEPLSPPDTLRAPVDAPPTGATGTVQATNPEPPSELIRATTVLGIPWLFGAAIFCGFVAWKRITTALLLLRNSWPAGDIDNALLLQLSQQLGVRRRVRLAITTVPLGPAVYGIFWPKILLPKHLLASKSTERLKHIIAHELTHVRRGDAAMAVLQLFSEVIWWFHPLVWWANREASRERERCCDEEVIAGLGCKPELYAQSLVTVLKLKRQLRPLITLPGVRPLEVTARRLEDIMNEGKVFHPRMPRVYWLVLATGATLLMPGAGLSLQASLPNPNAVSEKKAAEQQPSEELASKEKRIASLANEVRELKVAMEDLKRIVKKLSGLSPDDAESLKEAKVDLKKMKATVKRLEGLVSLSLQTPLEDALQHLGKMFELKFHWEYQVLPRTPIRIDVDHEPVGEVLHKILKQYKWTYAVLPNGEILLRPVPQPKKAR